MEDLNKTLLELKGILSDAMITQIDLDLKIKLVCKLNEALSIANVVGRSEQFICYKQDFERKPKCISQCQKCRQYESKSK